MHFSLCYFRKYENEMHCSMHNIIVHRSFFILNGEFSGEKIENEGYFPHLLPLKEGGEGNPPHLHFSLCCSHQRTHKEAQSVHTFIAKVIVFFICFYCHV